MAKTNKSNKPAPETSKTPSTPVFATELELKSLAQPEKQKAYRVTLAGEVGYTYANNPDAALVKLAKKQGGKSNGLSKTLNPDQLLGEVLSLPPEHLKALLAKVNSNAAVA